MHLKLLKIAVGTFLMLLFPYPVLSQNTMSITVQSPNGGEVWAKGSQKVIRWASTGISGPFRLILIKGETVYGDIELNAAAQGSYSWVVGDCPASGHSAEAGRGYRIRIIASENPSIRDDSNAPFIITPRSPNPGTENG